MTFIPRPKTHYVRSDRAKPRAWTKGEEAFNRALDELHIASLKDKDMQKAARINLNKLTLRRGTE